MAVRRFGNSLWVSILENYYDRWWAHEFEQAAMAAAAKEATTRLERYLADERLARQFPDVRFVGLAVVLHGWELAFCDAVA